MRNWERPMAVVDAFVANEFVSACGNKNKEYLFECDAGGGDFGKVYLETNGKPGLQTIGGYDHFTYGHYSADRSLGGYYACGKKHTAKTTDDFKQGYYIKNWTNDIVDVIVWRGESGRNVHCTTNLNMNTWETAKS